MIGTFEALEHFGSTFSWHPLISPSLELTSAVIANRFYRQKMASLSVFQSHGGQGRVKASAMVPSFTKSGRGGIRGPTSSIFEELPHTAQDYHTIGTVLRTLPRKKLPPILNHLPVGSISDSRRIILADVAGLTNSEVEAGNVSLNDAKKQATKLAQRGTHRSARGEQSQEVAIPVFFHENNLARVPRR